MQSFIKIGVLVFEKNDYKTMTLCNFNKDCILAIKYEDTNDYYWPLISTKDETSYLGPIGFKLPEPDSRGPFGFGDAVQMSEDKVPILKIDLRIFSVPTICKYVRTEYFLRT